MKRVIRRQFKGNQITMSLIRETKIKIKNVKCKLNDDQVTITQQSSLMNKLVNQ